MTPFTRKHRMCRPFGGVGFFKPRGVPLSELEVLSLELDELEAVHLCDFEELSQQDAAARMQISDSTLQRLLYAGRKKIADAVYSSKALQINTPESVQFLSEHHCPGHRHHGHGGHGQGMGKRGKRCR